MSAAPNVSPSGNTFIAAGDSITYFDGWYNRMTNNNAYALANWGFTTNSGADMVQQAGDKNHCRTVWCQRRARGCRTRHSVNQQRQQLGADCEAIWIYSDGA